MNSKNVFSSTAACLSILVLASCSKIPEDEGHGTFEKPASHNEKTSIEQVQINHPAEMAAFSTGYVDVATMGEKSVAFQQSLEASLGIGNALLTASELTDEHIEAFIYSFEKPWDADRVLWNDYMRTRDTNKLVVAERIFRFLIDNYDDSKTQAYARDHLGRVLLRKGEYMNALDMFESVQIQPDGQDFWYSAAREEAGEVAYKMLGNVQYTAQRKTLYKRAEANLNAALEVNKCPAVQAELYELKGHVYMNYNYQKSFDAFKTAYDIFLAEGNDNNASFVRPFMDEALKKLDIFGPDDFGL